MNFHNKFRLNSFILYPHWIILFSFTCAIFFTPLFIMGHEPSMLEFVFAPIVSSIIGYFLITRYRIVALFAIIVSAVFFTICTAIGLALIGYDKGGIMSAVLIAITVCGLSYLIHKFALTPYGEPNQQPIFFFF